MLRRTLIVLTPALFALPLLLTPTSQVYADADMMGSVYSGLECKYLDSYAVEGQMMAGGDVVYDSRLGIGNNAPASRPGANGVSAEDAVYRMSVGCPLPALTETDTVAVAVIDATVFDDVTCRVQSCVAGLGVGQHGVGADMACTNGSIVSTNSRTGQPPYTQPEKYITQNVDWLVLSVELPGDQPEAGLELPEPGREDQHVSSLLCTLPEQDDMSPAAPGLADQDRMDQGISYIQLYRVE